MSKRGKGGKQEVCHTSPRHGKKEIYGEKQIPHALAKCASGFGMTISKLRMAIYFFRRERTRGSSVMGTKSPGRRQVYTSALVAPEVAAAPDTPSFFRMKTPCRPGLNFGALAHATSRVDGKRRPQLF